MTLAAILETIIFATWSPIAVVALILFREWRRTKKELNSVWRYELVSGEGRGPNADQGYWMGLDPTKREIAVTDDALRQARERVIDLRSKGLLRSRNTKAAEPRSNVLDMSDIKRELEVPPPPRR